MRYRQSENKASERLAPCARFDGKPRFSKEPFVAYGMPDAVNGVLEEILLRS